MYQVLINGKGFFEIPLKMAQKHMNQLSKWEGTMITLFRDFTVFIY